MENPFITAEHLTFSYDEGNPVFEDISFSLKTGKLYALMGGNGSGKTTVLRCLTRLLPGYSGSISMNGSPLKSLTRRETSRLMSIVPQEHTTIFPYLVKNMVLMGRAPYVDTFDSPGKKDRDVARQAMEDVGIMQLSDKLYTRISGGERQQAYSPLSTDTRIIKDMAGREVVLPVEVKRVVSAMYAIATQLMFLVQAQELLVGISDMNINGVMERIYPPIVHIYRPGRTYGGDITKEEIIKMRPDLVFIHTHNALVNNYSDAGIASVCLRLETPDELIAGIELVGEIVNRQQRAAQIASYYREKLDYIRERTSNITERKKVYFAGPAMLSTAGGDFYQNYVIEYAGGINVASQGRGGWCSVSLEHLLDWNPDFIFIGNYGTARATDFTDDPRLSEITAVKNSDVFMARYYIGSWDVPTPESLLGIMWLANTLYPEQISFDMNAEARGFYTRFHGTYPIEIALEK